MLDASARDSPSMAQLSLPATSWCRVAEDEQNIKKI